MKTILIFFVTVSICAVVACSGVDENSAISPNKDNLTIFPIYKYTPPNLFKINVWGNGLTDHEIRNAQIGNSPILSEQAKKVSFAEISAINFSTSPNANSSKHFAIVNNPSNLLISKINQYKNSIDGIFVGFVTTGSSLNPIGNMIISLAKVDSVRYPSKPNCAVEKMTYFRTQQVTVNFKCTDRNLGIWEMIPETDPLIVAFKNSKKGVFIGKNNLFNNIFRKSSIMYLYSGVFNSNRYYVAVDKPYFTPTNAVGSGFPPVPLNPFYLSTLKESAPDCANFIYHTHGTARVCPNNCPE